MPVISAESKLVKCRRGRRRTRVSLNQGAATKQRCPSSIHSCLLLSNGSGRLGNKKSGYSLNLSTLAGLGAFHFTGSSKLMSDHKAMICSMLLSSLQMYLVPCRRGTEHSQDCCNKRATVLYLQLQKQSSKTVDWLHC